MLMMCLAVELGKLPKYLASVKDGAINEEEKAKNSQHLLKPLELIVSCDDSVVR